MKALFNSLIFAVAVFPAATVNAVEPPIHYGRTLPLPIPGPVRNVGVHIPRVTVERQVEFPLTVDTSGEVTAVDFTDTMTVRALDYLEAYFSQLKMIPGSIEGEPSEMKIMVRARFFPTRGVPIFEFPVTAEGRVQDHDLYFESISLNGVTLPDLKSYPSYGCYLDENDSLVTLPVALLEVDLDSSGNVAERSVLIENDYAPSSQLLATLLWSEFSPAEVDGRAVSSRVFLAVVCVKRSNKIMALRTDAPFPDSVSLQEQYRVRMLHDTIGVLLPAIPVSARSHQVTVRVPAGAHLNEMSVWGRIDTSGNLRPIRVFPVHPSVRRTINGWTREFKFFPALDFNGRPVTFQGLIHLEARTPSDIRISYFW